MACVWGGQETEHTQLKRLRTLDAATGPLFVTLRRLRVLPNSVNVLCKASNQISGLDQLQTS
jgi:hypothetical protein